MLKRNETTNLCETCENVEYLTDKDMTTKQEIRCYQCPYADKHSYDICKCSHYSNPNGFQRFLRNKLAVTFLGLTILTGLISIIITTLLPS